MGGATDWFIKETKKAFSGVYGDFHTAVTTALTDLTWKEARKITGRDEKERNAK